MSRTDFQSTRQPPHSGVELSAQSAEAATGHATVLQEEVLGSRLVAEGSADLRSVSQDSSRTHLLALSDVLAIVLALGVTIGTLALVGRDLSMFRVGVTAALLIPAWFSIAYVVGLYSQTELRINQSVVDQIGKVLIAATAWSWLLLMARMVFSAGPTSMLGPTLLWMLVISLVLIGRAIAGRSARARSRNLSRVAVVGWPNEAKIVCDRVERHPEWGIAVEAEYEFGRDDEFGLEDLADRIGGLDIDRVMILGGSEGLIDRTRLASLLVERGLTIDLVAGGAESLYSKSVLHDLEGLPVMSMKPTQMRSVDLIAKRSFDVLVSGVGILLVSPLLLWAAVRIKLDSRGPVFFRQVRCGIDGEALNVVKFRTMCDGADEMRPGLRETSEGERNGDVLFKLAEDPRVTQFGQTLRKWSIDELPQLFNVLRGEMSIVGPRPLPYDEAVQATGIYKARMNVKPGLAGPWQAYGRSNIPFADMIRLDYSYAVGWSMAEDLRLLLRTAVAVFSRRGAY